jgi:hypothetical protein
MGSGDGFPAHLLSRMIHVGHSQIDLFSFSFFLSDTSTEIVR